jgi:hypothetical protein
VEFDAGRGNVLKDGWRVARFGLEAASAAARVSGAVGRPVKLAYG